MQRGLARLSPNSKHVIVDGAGHLGLVREDRVSGLAIAWLAELAADRAPRDCGAP